MNSTRLLSWKTLGFACAALAAAGIVHDLVRTTTSPQTAPIPQAPPQPPPDILNPAAAAYRPTADEWKAYLRKPPLAVGQRVPSFRITDHRDRTVSTPSKEKPTVWAVLCGCRDCASGGDRILGLQNRAGRKAEVVMFVSSSSNYVWDRMKISFGGIARMVRDDKGDHYRLLRAPGDTYSPLPMIWGIRKGRVSYFDRPEKEETGWVEALRRALDLPEVENSVYGLP